MSFPKRLIIPKTLPHGLYGGNFTALYYHTAVLVPCAKFFPEFNIIHLVHRDYNHPYTPTNAYKLYRITIIHTHEFSYMIQKYIITPRETLIQRNIKLIHPIYIYVVKNKY